MPTSPLFSVDGNSHEYICGLRHDLQLQVSPSNRAQPVYNQYRQSATAETLQNRFKHIAQGLHISQGRATVDLHSARIMDTLQNGLTNLTFGLQSSPSLLDDKVFRAFYAALQQDAKGEIWHFLVTYQDYPDPGILLQVESFAKDIARSEPGKQVNYEKVRKDLNTAQGELSGSHDDKERLFKLCNKLVESHVNYVRATAKVLGYELYDKLIDRFDNKVKDKNFEHFLATSVPSDLVRSWPSYNKIKQGNANNLRTWHQHQTLATYNIEHLKSSVELKVFLAKLKSAVERHEGKQRRVARKVTPTHRHRLCPQAQTAYSAQAHRRASIEKRNRIVSAERAARNERLKAINLANIHQLGDQSRICLPNSVIHALSDIQDKYQATIEDNKDHEKDDGDGGGLHVAVQKMHIGGEDSGEDALSGIIIPEGFVHLGPMVGGGAGLQG
ncbi:hypothetical protein PMZ80_003644 [Knufia obscura]|uniref:Uncharacterized protein n=2 Tax=Knufia TaxID=430999 RepID=A0AAN8EMA8_9EURO|nr:hypothetical protein PMZ80_003644 [Knufia obscura]KAK5958443.1 hypothetical protein OHC33_000286 [Knufia fluminis]